MKTTWLVAGLAAGYVLGTRAGREKYEQIVATVQNLASTPTVTSAQETVKEAVARGRDTVLDKIGGEHHDTKTVPAVVNGVPASSI